MSYPIVQIKKEYMGAGKRGQLLFTVMLDQLWSMVIWNDEEDPDCFKTAGLEDVSMKVKRRKRG